MVHLSLSNFSFYPIEDECRDLFKCAKGNLSDFHSFALTKCADAIAAKEIIFADNHCWWDMGDARCSLFMTDNGILMYTENDKLFRVEFNK